jgi:hypothetical protein
MGAFWAGDAAAFLEAPMEDLLGELSRNQVWHYRTSEAAQMPAWRDSLVTLKLAVGQMTAAGFAPFVLLEFGLLRLGKRIDAIL